MRDFKYLEAARLLPPSIRAAALSLDEKKTAQAEEFRLRAGRAPTVLLAGRESELPGAGRVSPTELDFVVEKASGASLHTAEETLREGFVTASGGHRVGICAAVGASGGEKRAVSALLSVNVRIAREIRGVADAVLPKLEGKYGFCSTIIISPPGAGKTTLLRDIIRGLSNGRGCGRSYRCAVADERREIAAVSRGVPQFDVGRHTDVIDGGGKADSLLSLIRCMNPEVAAVDEITRPEDLRAAEAAAGCGVKLIATIHAGGLDELRRRDVWRELGEIFERAVVISRENGSRRYRVYETEESGA